MVIVMVLWSIVWLMSWFISWSISISSGLALSVFECAVSWACQLVLGVPRAGGMKIDGTLQDPQINETLSSKSQVRVIAELSRRSEKIESSKELRIERRYHVTRERKRIGSSGTTACLYECAFL